MPSIELSISDTLQLGPLEYLLRREMPELGVSRSVGDPEPGALGWEDVLVLTFAGISALDAVIDIVRSYLDTAKKHVQATITATNSTGRGTRTLVLQDATEAQVADFMSWVMNE